jgi:hypothetical protein
MPPKKKEQIFEITEEVKEVPTEEPKKKAKRKPVKEQTIEEEDANYQKRQAQMSRVRQAKIDKKNRLAYELGEMPVQDYSKPIEELKNEIKELKMYINKNNQAPKQVVALDTPKPVQVATNKPVVAVATPKPVAVATPKPVVVATPKPVVVVPKQRERVVYSTFRTAIW